MSNRRIAVILFDGFELLDVFGPVELYFQTPGFEISYAGPQRGPVASSQGCEVVAELSYDELRDPDIILVPGGVGSRKLVDDATFLKQLHTIGAAAELITSVCTGSALLAAAGLLDGYRATSNKMAWEWASSHGASVDWVAVARWIEDRDRWTSSGVAAGMDMAVALITVLAGEDAARTATVRTELEVQSDSTHDPFAAIHGLV